MITVISFKFRTQENQIKGSNRNHLGETMATTDCNSHGHRLAQAQAGTLTQCTILKEHLLHFLWPCVWPNVQPDVQSDVQLVVDKGVQIDLKPNAEYICCIV